MSSAEPAESTPGGNESDTSEQGRSEASSSSQDTSATNDTSPTNDTSLEEEDAPVEDDKYKYITWSNKTRRKCFSGQYKEEGNELAKLIARLWPYAFDYRPEVILKKATDRSNKLVYHLDVADSDSHDTLFPDGALPWKGGRGEAIENLKLQLQFMADGGVRAPVDRTDAEAVLNEVKSLKRRLDKFPSRPYDYGMIEPDAKHSTYALTARPRHKSKGVERLIGEFDTKAKMAVALEKKTRKAVLDLESQESQPKRQWIRKSIR
ncbi:hypothetical protein J4E81_008416 [Alternaria sp. BMP 2799]|nr:hypothetical protein J4E81_008416 [Alternaria sp. BMP 2799]